MTPTFRDVNKKYSTRYYLSLVLIDEGMFARIRIVYISMHFTFNPFNTRIRFSPHMPINLLLRRLGWVGTRGLKTSGYHFLSTQHPTASHSLGQ